MPLLALNPAPQEPEPSPTDEPSSEDLPLNVATDSEAESTQTETTQAETLQPVANQEPLGMLSDPAFWFWPIAALFLVAFVFVTWRLITAKRPVEVKVDTEPEEPNSQFVKTDPFLPANHGVDRVSFDQALAEFDEKQRPLNPVTLEFDVKPFRSAPKMANLKTQTVADDEKEDAFDFSEAIKEEQLGQSERERSTPRDDSPKKRDPGSDNGQANGGQSTNGSKGPSRPPNGQNELSNRGPHLPNQMDTPSLGSGHGLNGAKRFSSDQLDRDLDDPIFSAEDSTFNSDQFGAEPSLETQFGDQIALDSEISDNAFLKQAVDTIEPPLLNATPREEVDMNFADDDSDQDFEFLMDTDIELDDSDVDLDLDAPASKNRNIRRDPKGRMPNRPNQMEDLDFQVAKPVQRTDLDAIETESQPATPPEGVLSKLFGFGKTKPQDDVPPPAEEPPPFTEPENQRGEGADASTRHHRNRFKQTDREVQGEEFALGAPSRSPADDDSDLNDDHNPGHESRAHLETTLAENRELLEHVKYVESENNHLTSALESARLEMRDSLPETDSQSSRIEELASENQRLQAEYDGLITRLDSEKAQVAQKHQQAKQERSELTRELESLRAKFKTEAEKLALQKAESKNAQKDYQSRIEKLNENFSLERTRFEEKNRALEQQHEQLQAELESSQTVSASERERLTQAESSLEQALADLESLKSKRNLDLDQAAEAISGEVASKQQLIAELAELKSKQQAEWLQLENQLATESESREILESELKALKNDLEDKRAESKQLEALREANHRLEKQVRELETTMAAEANVAQERQTTETESAQLIQNELTRLKSEFGERTSEFETQLAEEMEARRELESEVEKLEVQLKTAQTEAAGRMREEDVARQKIAEEMAANQTRLESELADAEGRLEHALETTQEFEAELYTLRSRLETEAELAASTLAEETEAKLKLRSKLNGSRARAKAKLAKLNESLTDAKKSKERLKRELRAAQAESAKPEELDDLRTQIASLSQENATLSTELEIAKSDLRKSDPVSKTAKPSASDLAERDPEFFRRFEKRLKAEYKKRKAAQKFLAQAEEQRDDLTGKLRETQDDVSRLEKQCKQLKSRIDQLDQPLDK